MIQPPVPTTISEANFQRMMDFWKEVSDRQELRIQDLVKELVELKNKESKEHEGNDKSISEKDSSDSEDNTSMQIFMKMAAEFPAILRRWEMDQILLRQRRLPEFFKMSE